MEKGNFNRNVVITLYSYPGAILILFQEGGDNA
jgi:hypothetical protein